MGSGSRCSGHTRRRPVSLDRSNRPARGSPGTSEGSRIISPDSSPGNGSTIISSVACSRGDLGVPRHEAPHFATGHTTAVREGRGLVHDRLRPECRRLRLAELRMDGRAHRRGHTGLGNSRRRLERFHVRRSQRVTGGRLGLRTAGAVEDPATYAEANRHPTNVPPKQDVHQSIPQAWLQNGRRTPCGAFR